MSIRSWLSEPRVRSVDVNSPGLIEVHREILASKPMMRSVFRDIYDACMGADRRYFSGDGLRVEVGAGVSLIKEYYPDVIATDIKLSRNIDQVVDALAMPFEAGSVRAIYGLNCFHHLRDPDRFFTELERVLVPGGGCILIEPYYGLFARWVYTRLFDTEGYDLDQVSWEASGEVGVMRGANQALSHVVFVRDRELLRTRHPGLELVGLRPLRCYQRYLLSGGLNFRQLLPSATIGLLKLSERVAAPVAPALALHHMIVLRKRAQPTG